MSLISRMRRQDAVYWPPLVRADRFGQERFGEPVAIRCRWESNISQRIEQNGTVHVVTDMAYVDRQLSLGGRLALGSLDEMENVATPTAASQEIVAFSELPNLRNTETLYTAFM